MFGPKVKKYLVLNSNDSKSLYYQAEATCSGIARCPTNPKKNSEVVCQVKFSTHLDNVSHIRVVCIGPPLLTAAGNYIAKEVKGKGIGYLLSCSRTGNLSTVLGADAAISKSQGLWVIKDAVDLAVRGYLDLGPKP